MFRAFSLLCVAILVVGATVSTALAQGKNLPIEAFYGRYTGAGFTFGHTGYRELQNRDLDVEIGPESDGFFVAWTTVLHRPSDDKATRKSVRMAFTPSAREGIYLQRSAEKSIGEGLVWAAVTGPRLTIRALTIEPDGSYVMQIYHRVIFENGMLLQYRSDSDSETIRLITGRLTKVK